MNLSTVARMDLDTRERERYVGKSSTVKRLTISPHISGGKLDEEEEIGISGDEW